jgi:hypothetical protein
MYILNLWKFRDSGTYRFPKEGHIERFACLVNKKALIFGLRPASGGWDAGACDLSFIYGYPL